MMQGTDSASAVVVTATIGEPQLVQAIGSVQRQTWANLRHLVVADGVQTEDAVRAVLNDVTTASVPTDLLVLPRNTGANGFNGHRIFAAMSYLVDDDVIFLLDADNWYDDAHVETCMRTLSRCGTNWCYGLRRLVLPNGDYLCDDDAESIGFWPRYIAHLVGTGLLSDDEERFFHRHRYLIDTNCLSVRREAFVRNAAAWLQPWRADAVFAQELIEREPGATTGEVSVSYRLGSANLDRMIEYYLEANEFMRQRFVSAKFPWRAAGIGVAHPLGGI